MRKKEKEASPLLPFVEKKTKLFIDIKKINVSLVAIETQKEDKWRREKWMRKEEWREREETVEKE